MRCYITGEECSCDFETGECPHDTFDYQDDYVETVDPADELGAVSAQFQQDFDAIYEEQMYDSLGG